MRARVIVLNSGLTEAQIAAVAAEVVRMGGDPKPMHDDDGAPPAPCAPHATGRVDRSPSAFSVPLDDAAASRLSHHAGVARVLTAPSPYPLAAQKDGGTRVVAIPLGVRDHVEIGGDRAVIIAGPCAVESIEQLEACAAAIAALGGRLLRGGAYKPRTSPYAFAGGGVEALAVLREVADRHRLGVVTEVLDPRDVARVAMHCDMMQIGARNMSNFPLLREVARARRPVLLKRSPSAPLDELLLAAEHLLHAGARDVVLCERGVRGFDPSARNLLDLAAVPLLRMRTELPILVDPSHGVGVRRAVIPMAAAAIAAGADGVIVECHPDAGRARSDGPQALPLDALPRLFEQVFAVAAALRASTRMDAAAE